MRVRHYRDVDPLLRACFSRRWQMAGGLPRPEALEPASQGACSMVINISSPDQKLYHKFITTTRAKMYLRPSELPFPAQVHYNTPPPIQMPCNSCFVMPSPPVGHLFVYFYIIILNMLAR
jgi:hypothetical protein